MCACNRTPCGREFEDGGEASQQQKDKKDKKENRGEKGKEEEEAPPPTWQERFDFFKKQALKLLYDAHKLCLKIQKDPFQSQVVKSSVYFSLGLKLFRDLARHLAPKKCGSQL